MPSPQLKDSEKKNTLNSKAVQFTPSIFSKSAQMQLQKMKHKSEYSYMAEKYWNSDLSSLSTQN